MANAGLEVRATRVHNETPHLISTGSGISSPSVTLHPLPEGRIIVGSSREADVRILESGVEYVHCLIENIDGLVTLHPVSGNTCIDGHLINGSVRLTQGCTISLGRSSNLRFNHPSDNKKYVNKINHHYQQQQQQQQQIPPQVPQRKSSTNIKNDYEEDINFHSKLNKFELLSRQQNLSIRRNQTSNGSSSGGGGGGWVSPKVFSSDALTTSVPAEQILSRPIQQQHQQKLPVNYNNYHNNHQNYQYKQTPFQNVTNFEHNNPVPNQGHNSTYDNDDYDDEEYSMNNNENRNMIMNSTSSSSSLMSKSFNCQSRPWDYDNNIKCNREFDMSQSLIVAKTTTCTEFLKIDNFGSNPNMCHKRTGSYDSHQETRDFGSNSNIKKIQPLSPAYNRDIKYNTEKKLNNGTTATTSYMINGISSPAITRMKSPVPINGTAVNYSMDKLWENKRKNDEYRCKQTHEELLRDKELERQEKIRLEEILAMCAEYERQSHTDKTKFNNHKSNNSSKDNTKKQINSESDTKIQSPILKKNNSIDKMQQVVSTKSPESKNNNNLKKNGYHNPKNSEDEDNEEFKKCIIRTPKSQDNNQKNGYLSVYENVTLPHSISNSINNNNNSNINNINVNNSYNNLTNIKTPPPKPKRMTRINNTELLNKELENKLDVSNDDLLEAIEQLSMLSSTSSSSKKSPVNSFNDFSKNDDNDYENVSNDQKIEIQDDDDDDKKNYIEFLLNEKQHILSNMDSFKRSVVDIETQEEEMHRELELEKALLSAEYESESLKLSQDDSEKIRIQQKIHDLENEMIKSTTSQAQLQLEAKQRVNKEQLIYNKLELELKELNNDNNNQLKDELIDKLTRQLDILESERKAFEDLEFHHLEEESSKLATREELQRYLTDITNKIDNRKIQLNQFETQRNDIKTAVAKESKLLERQKLENLRRIEEARNRLRDIDEELENLTATKNLCENNDDKQRSPSREDFDRISRVTTDSPIVNNGDSLGKKTIESFKEIERNRQLHLAKQGSQVISDERRRVEELKRRVQDEVRSQWEERKMNCTSFNSIESGEESSSYSTGPTESGSGSSDGADNGTNEKLSPGSKLSEFTSPSPGPSSGNSYSLLQSDNIRDERPTSMETERYNGNGSTIIDDSESRPLSQTSSELDALSPLQVKYRDKPKLQRPLTRFLPIKSESLDLRYHIETAGHQLQLINDVNIDTTTCCGYLSKMSKKFHHWNKRWFVFDRKNKTLSYYSDSSARKSRGVIYFQSIEEVYVDHLNTVKSPHPSLTFIVKTKTRIYHLMAPSAEAMRVWVDVVFTGAEGYHEFDHDT